MAGYEKDGWRKKYFIQKYDRKDGFLKSTAKNARYFVLRFDKDPHARVAMAAYADSVEAVNPKFAKDIREKIRPHNRRAAEKEKKPVVMKHLLTIIILALALAGCSVEAKYTDKEGRVFEYRREGAQQIGEVLLELADGTTFLMDGQKSELPPVKITATSITIGGKEVKP